MIEGIVVKDMRHHLTCASVVIHRILGIGGKAVTERRYKHHKVINAVILDKFNRVIAIHDTLDRIAVNQLVNHELTLRRRNIGRDHVRRLIGNCFPHRVQIIDNRPIDSHIGKRNILQDIVLKVRQIAITIRRIRIRSNIPALECSTQTANIRELYGRSDRQIFQRLVEIFFIDNAILVDMEYEVETHRRSAHAENRIRLVFDNNERLAIFNSYRSRAASIDKRIRTEIIEVRCRCKLDTEIHVRHSRDFNAIANIVLDSGSMDSIDILIDLEAPLGSIHARRDGELFRYANRARSISIARIRPNGVQRTYILAFFFAFINLAESFDIEQIYLGGNIVLVKRPAAHASIRATHDGIRQQILRLRNVSNRVGIARLHRRAVEHGLAIRIVSIVIERVAILQNRSLDGVEVHTGGKQSAIRVVAPNGSRRSTLDSNLLFRIQNYICTGTDIKRNAVERNVVRRDVKHPRRHHIFTDCRGQVSTAERPRERIGPLFGTNEIDCRNRRNTCTPDRIQRHRIGAAIRTCGQVRLFVVGYHSVIEFRVGDVAVISERVALQAVAIIAVHRHREALVSTFDGVIIRNNPVARDNIFGERFRSDVRLPRVAEVSLAVSVFVEGEVVLHGFGGHAERQVLLGINNMKRITIIDVP